jgi:hypothetical protein
LNYDGLPTARRKDEGGKLMVERGRIKRIIKEV